MQARVMTDHQHRISGRGNVAQTIEKRFGAGQIQLIVEDDVVMRGVQIGFHEGERFARPLGGRAENDLRFERQTFQGFCHDGDGAASALIQGSIEIIEFPGFPARFGMTKKCKRKHCAPELALRMTGRVYSTSPPPLSVWAKFVLPD